MEIKEELEQSLQNINITEGVLASLLIRKDGLLLTFISKDVNLNKEVAVSLVSVFNTFEQSAEEIKTGPLNYLLVKANNKNMFFIEVSKDIILVLFLDATADINRIYEESSKTTQKILEILS